MMIQNVSISWVTSHWNRLRSQKKTMCHSPRKGQKWPNRRVWTTSQFSCIRGHEPLKSSRNQKNCAQLPRKTARIDKIDEFGRRPNFRVPGVTSRWNQPGAKKTVCYGPRKRSEMTKSMSFNDVSMFVYPGSRAFEIVPGAKKLCSIAHENGQKWPNRRVLTTSHFRVPGVTSSWDRHRNQKLCASPWKRPEMTKSTSFEDVPILM